MVLELNKGRKDGRRHYLLINVIGKIAKFILNLPEMITNALIVSLSISGP